MSQLTLYTTGTITFTNASDAITGVGTTFIGLQQGDLVLAPDDKWYELAAAPSDNLAATLDRVYTGTTVTNSPGGDWVILRSSIQRDSVRTATRQLTDISSLWRQLISMTQSDQVIRPSKALTTDRAGLVLQKALTDLFQVGTFEDDDFSIRYLLASTWTKALGIDPTSGATSLYSQILLGGVISPAILTSTTNNYAPAGLAQANVLRLSTNATRTLTGITTGAPGRVLALMNAGSFDLALENEGGSSAAANRFALSSNLTIPAGGAVLLIYDGVANRWRVLGGAGSGSGGAMGAKGWSPILAYVSNGEGGKVAQIVDWTGGEGIKPAVGAYIGATGQVATVAEAVNVVGPKGDQVQFRMNGAVLQWTYAGSLDWQDLYTLDLIIGPPSALQWTFSIATADVDPGAGKLRFDSATFGSISQIFINQTEHFGVDVSAFLDTWDDSTATIKGTLTLIDPATPQIAVFNVTGITAASGYRKLAVTPVVGDIFTDARLLSVQFVRTGNNGVAATIAVGAVTTLAAGAQATVANAGNATAATFNFGIPQGVQGVQGVKGDTGDTGPSYKGTSTTSLMVSAGAKSVTTQAGLAYLPGARTRLSSVAAPTTFIEGVVATYNPATGALTFTADKIGGSGTLASWNINLAGEPGVGDMSAANNLAEVNAASAATNLGVVRYGGAQSLTADQKTRARANIDVLKKNYIVNGGMQISQENGTTPSSANNYYPADQWVYARSLASGVASVGQVVAATPGGSTHRIRATVTTAQASIGSDYAYLSQAIEGNRVADLWWGSAVAKAVTVNVGLKAPVAGTYLVQILNSGSTVAASGTITITPGEVGVDVVKQVVIAGATTGAWATDNTAGFVLRVFLAFAANQTANVFATNGNVFELFDVGLYEGSAAPSFQLPEFNQELELCQRYWEKSYDYAVAPGTAGNYNGVRASLQNSAPASYGAGNFVKRKRAAPTVTLYSPASGAAGNGYDTVDRAATAARVGETGYHISNAFGVSTTPIMYHFTANARLI